MSDNIVKFPADTPEARGARERCERKNENANRFLELDEPIFRAAMLAEIVFDLMYDDNPEGKCREQTAWATMELCVMIRGIRKIFRGEEETTS